MTLPFGLSGGPREPGPDDFARLLRSLLPDGYVQSDDDPFFYELEAWAIGLHFLDQQRRKLLANMYRSSTVEMLDEWEREYGLIADAARDIEQRQARLVAAELAHGGTSPERLATALAQIDAGIEIAAPSREQIEQDSLGDHSSELIFQLLTTVSIDTWTSRDKRKALARLLERIVPARCFGQDGVPSMEATFSTAEAKWDGSGVLGRTNVRLTDTQTATVEPLVRRVRSWGPGSVLRAQDLHALQDSFLRKPSRGEGGTPTTLEFTTMTAGDERWCFSFDVPAHDTILLSTDEWRKRFLWVCARVTMNSDTRPGHASDDAFNSGTQYSRLDATGAGWNVGGATGLRSLLTSDVSIFVNDSDGRLYLRNGHATQHAYVSGFIERTAQYDDATGTGDRLVTSDDGVDLTTAGVDAAFYTDLRKRSLLRYLEVASFSDAWPDYEGDGGHAVLAYLVNVSEGTNQLLDDVIDWRDRMVFVTALAVNSEIWSVATAPAGPLGAWADYVSGPDVLSRSRLTAKAGSADPGAELGVLGYTRTGLANGDVGNAAKCIQLSSELRVWVDSTSGALQIKRDTAATYHQRETYLILVEASFATGQRSTPDVWTTPAPIDTDFIAPLDLNAIQDRGLAGVASRSHPLGRHHVGGAARPYMPELLRHHDVATPQGRGCAGWTRRVFATAISATSELVLDDTIDWRDRFVRARVSRSATYDILPGHADQAHANDGGAPVFQTCTARYTGPGGKAATALDRGFHVALLSDTSTGGDGICLYARTTDGALMLRNGNGLTQHIHGFIDATFQLGLSS